MFERPSLRNVQGQVGGGSSIKKEKGRLPSMEILRKDGFAFDGTVTS